MRPVAARSWLRSVLRAGLPLLLIGLVTGCGMIPPEPKTEAAKSVFTLYNIVFAMGTVVFVLVEGFIVYSVFRYRRRDDRLPPQTHGNTLVEIIWTAIPTVIVLILFVLSVSTLATVEAKSDPSKGGVDIEVDGFQWQWEFRYLDSDQNNDNDVSVIGDQANPPVMVVPVGEPVRLTLVSRDVIHSFYVPQFLIKRDVIPVPDGEDVNHLEFVVSEPGTYGGQCAEFCGDFHANMTFSVQAVSPADYEKWLARRQGRAHPAAVGPIGGSGDRADGQQHLVRQAGAPDQGGPAQHPDIHEPGGHPARRGDRRRGQQRAVQERHADRTGRQQAVQREGAAGGRVHLLLLIPPDPDGRQADRRVAERRQDPWRRLPSPRSQRPISAPGCSTG